MSDEPTPPDLPTPPPPPPVPDPNYGMVPQQAIYAPPGTLGSYLPTQDERTMGMLIHLLALLTGFIGCLILWLVKKDTSQFIDHHGKEAVNFQITLFIVSMASVVIGGVITLATAGIGLIIVVPLMAVIFIGALVMEILSCVKANRGEWSRYAINIRFIK